MSDKIHLYMLMHKDEEIGAISIDSSDSKVSGWKLKNAELAPFLGNATLDNIKKWWSIRAVPGSRKMIEAVIRKAGCESTLEYLAKNLGLSMTDTYWIRPIDSSLTWESVSLHNLRDFNEGKIPYHNITSYDPNAALSGQMEKYWDLNGPNPVLIKTASEHFGQQSINELFATLTHERQDCGIPYTKYGLIIAEDKSIQSKCDAFTSIDKEFVSAYEILNSQSISNDQSNYEAFIQICSTHGIDCESVRRFMDYQTLTDFILGNTDEHLLNFGILRDTSSGQFISTAPIFDTGNSMFYSYDSRKNGFSRIEILEQEITAIHSTWEKMLGHITYKDIVREDLLMTPSEVQNFYEEHGIPEQKANMISKSYKQKLSLLHDFQKGLTISLYKEKQKQ